MLLSVHITNTHPDKPPVGLLRFTQQLCAIVARHLLCVCDPPLLHLLLGTRSRMVIHSTNFIRISSNASLGWKYTRMSTTYSKETFQLVRAAENVPVKVQSILAKLGR